jgi:hypothetical protein
MQANLPSPVGQIMSFYRFYMVGSRQVILGRQLLKAAMVYQ